MTTYQDAVLRHRRAGGQWPPKAALPRWSGSGSGRWHPLARWAAAGYAPVRCAECGAECPGLFRRRSVRYAGSSYEVH